MIGTWQPIETALMPWGDLLLFPGVVKSVTLGFFDPTNKVWFDHDAQEEFKPTHWMTPPVPPTHWINKLETTDA